ncbi:MAG: T9SS type A sorting domain-containing protein, partial [Flavobacteriales bacterium]|nr:T9SS type A sorting domain-containing protein [Flavobacteriales bacterium]
AVVNIGCRHLSSYAGELYCHNNTFYYATHVKESIHLTDLGVLDFQEEETLLLALDENLELSWYLLSDASNGDVGFSLALAFDDQSIFMSGLHQGIVTFGDQELEATEGWDGYILEISNPNSIENQDSLNNEVFVHPNPVQRQGNLIVQAPMNQTIESYEFRDVAGRVIINRLNREKTHQVSIPIHSMESGLYYLFCHLNNGTESFARVVVE